MQDASLDVIAVGNAIVDVTAEVEEGWLASHGVDKGVMTLIDAGRAEALEELVAWEATESSGGSAANTAAGLAALGGRAGFIGRVRDDRAGGVFRDDIRAAGVAFDTPAGREGGATARCFVFVSPDAQRSMQTHLGASVEIGPDDVDEAAVAGAAVTYLEGYLWDAPGAKAAFLRAADAARAAGRRVALTLSDPLCVERHRESFAEFVRERVDILFANEAEISALLGARDVEDAAGTIAEHVAVAALTRSERGSLVVAGDRRHVVEAEPAPALVDTTGAGDLYAAGFLYGLTRGWPPGDCGRLAALAASDVVQQFGARPGAILARLPALARGP